VLDTIEADGAHHWTQRKEMVVKRRREDDADDIALFLGVPASESEEIDDLGRTVRDGVGPYASVRKYRREARLTRRQRRPSAAESDGYSTDATLAPADEEDYGAAQAALRVRAAALDADVKAEEFLYPARGIGRRFAEWRAREEDEYQAAFGGLGCVQGWEYWARKEMVGWEPSRSSRSVDSFDWFQALHAYSHPQRPDDMDTSDDEEPPLAPEGDMAAAMVASLVTRLVERAITAGEYDVYSAGQTRRLGDLVDLISDYTGKEGQKYKVGAAGRR
jgi:GC-rich sequence DNA-binding factor